MRKILFTVCILLACITTSMAQQESYKIEGRLDNSVNGQLKLVAETEQGLVELGDITITNGNFEFSGRMPEVTLAYLMTSNKKNTLAVIMLENANYMITMGPNQLIVEGGEAQKIWKEFNDLNDYLTKSGQELDAKARTARSPMEYKAYQQEFQKLAAQVETEELALLKKYNDTYAAAYTIASKMAGTDENKLIERYELLGENAKTTLYGKQVAKILDKMKAVAIGSIAPDFSAPLSDGGVLSLHETKAKVKIIDFWASWCRPCRDENVNLVKIYKRFRPKGLEIISFSIDDNKHNWLGAIGQDGSTWKNVSDLKAQKSEIATLYCVSAIPYTLILDEDNRIVAKNLRGRELEKKIEEMLKKKK